MTREQIHQRIAGFMASRFELDAKAITSATRFHEDLGLDSIDVIDMTIEMRELTGQKIEESDLRTIACVGDVVAVVERLLRARAG